MKRLSGFIHLTTAVVIIVLVAAVSLIALKIYKHKNVLGEQSQPAPKFYYPMDCTHVTTPWGTVPPYEYNPEHFHYGIDFRANYQSFRAVTDGTITYRNWRYWDKDPKRIGTPKWIHTGNTIEETLGSGDKIVYAHLSKMYVSLNQKVSAGQVLGVTGNSDSQLAHLHLGIIHNGSWVDPLSYLLNHSVKSFGSGYVDTSINGCR